MTHPIASALLLATLAALGAGCAQPSPTSRADAVASAACRQHADRVYALRNPDAVYRQDTYDNFTRDTPFSSNGVPGVTSAGLSGAFERDQLFGDCLNDVGAAPESPAPEEGPAKTAPTP